MKGENMVYRRRKNFQTVRDVVVDNTSRDILMEERRSYRIDFREIANEIRNFHGKISVITDYDVDGVMSACLADLLLTYLKKDFEVYVPHRMSDGYGLSEKIIDKLSGNLIITIDNGIAAIDAVKKAKDLHKSVIIIDHHLPAVIDKKEVYPDADYIMDLQANHGTADFTMYCAAGLTYKLLCSMINDKRIRDEALSYAAIATIADMVPLRGDNRKIVKEGLRLLSKREGLSDAMEYLLYKCYLNEVTEKDIGFCIAPIINAAGRLYDNGGQYCYQSIMKKDDFVRNIEVLIKINEHRKIITKDIIKCFHEKIEKEKLQDANSFVFYMKDIPEGIVGLVAGNLAETYCCPAIVMTDAKEKGFYKGSGRTYGKINIKNELDQCSESIYKYGGHAAAVGLTVEAKEFRNLYEKLQKNLGVKAEPVKYYDIEVERQDEIPCLVEELKRYAPYGVGNPEPVFYIKEYDLYPTKKGFYSTFGKDGTHVRFFGKNGIVAVGFSVALKYEQIGMPKCFSIIGTLSEKKNQYQSMTQIEIMEVFPCQQKDKKTELSRQLEFLAKKRRE